MKKFSLEQEVSFKTGEKERLEADDKLDWWIWFRLNNNNSFIVRLITKTGKIKLRTKCGRSINKVFNPDILQGN